MLELISVGENIFIIVDEKFNDNLEILGSIKIKENKSEDKLVINRSDANLWIDELNKKVEQVRNRLYGSNAKNKTLVFTIDCIIYFLLESNKRYVRMIDVQEMLSYVYHFLRDNSLIKNYKSYITCSILDLIQIIISNIHIFKITTNLDNICISDFDYIYLNDDIDLSRVSVRLDETLKGIIRDYVKNQYNN